MLVTSQQPARATRRLVTLDDIKYCIRRRRRPRFWLLRQLLDVSMGGVVVDEKRRRLRFDVKQELCSSVWESGWCSNA